ncbi:MAG: hypothetical protein ACI4MO_04745 [Christensenellales bacterium]
MRIAIDLDGVVFNSEMYFMAIGEIYDSLILGKNSIVKADEPRVQNKYAWNEKELQGYIDRYANSLDFDIMPCAKMVIDSLRKNNELYVISARGQFNKEEIEIAKKKLEEAEIYFDHYYFGYLDKNKIVNDCKIDVMIDDRYDVCESLSQQGVLCLYFRMAGRKEVGENELLKEVHNWGEIFRILKDKKVIGDTYESN